MVSFVELPALMGSSDRVRFDRGQPTMALVAAREPLRLEPAPDRGLAGQGAEADRVEFGTEGLGAPAGVVVSPLAQPLPHRRGERTDRPDTGPPHLRGQRWATAVAGASSPFSHGVAREVHLRSDFSVGQPSLGPFRDAEAFFEGGCSSHGYRLLGRRRTEVAAAYWGYDFMSL